MPAINFQARFVEAILNGTKKHTIRKARTDKGAPRQGQMLYLYTGMRTKHCKKIMQLECEYVVPISIRVSPYYELDVFICNQELSREAVNKLCDADGFESEREMALWIQKQYDGIIDGVLIGWEPIEYKICGHEATTVLNLSALGQQILPF